MTQVMQYHQESRQAEDGELSALKALVKQLTGQVKGQGKVSDRTPEASGAGDGNPPAPQRRAKEGAPGGESDLEDEGEVSGRKAGESRKGRSDDRLTPQPEDHNDSENNQQFNLFS